MVSSTIVQRKFFDAKKIELSEPLNESILFEEINVSEVNEIKPNWILAFAGNNILVLHDWNIIKKFRVCSPTDP